MIILRNILFLILVSMHGKAQAQNLIPETAQQVLTACQTYIAIQDRQHNPTSEDLIESAACLNIVRGISAGIVAVNTVNQDKNLTCIPGNVDFQQMARIIVRGIQDRPDALHLQGNAVAASILVTNFTCNRLRKN